MSYSNGKLASLGENRVPIVSTCDSPSSTSRNFHYLARYPTARWCTRNFLQQSEVNTHDGRYRGGRGHDRGGEQGVKGKRKNFTIKKDK
jgi:hypothetical protein